ncbi:MAG: hypothetical protein AAGH19_03515, partial [Pseudomonadota bacterium]
DKVMSHSLLAEIEALEDNFQLPLIDLTLEPHRDLPAGTVRLDSAVQVDGDRLLIITALIEPNSDEVLWSDIHQRTVHTTTQGSDFESVVFEVSERIAKRVVTMIKDGPDNSKE